METKSAACQNIPSYADFNVKFLFFFTAMPYGQTERGYTSPYRGPHRDAILVRFATSDIAAGSYKYKYKKDICNIRAT